MGMTSKEKEALPPEAIPMPLDNVTDADSIKDIQTGQTVVAQNINTDLERIVSEE